MYRKHDNISKPKLRNNKKQALNQYQFDKQLEEALKQGTQKHETRKNTKGGKRINGR